MSLPTADNPVHLALAHQAMPPYLFCGTAHAALGATMRFIESSEYSVLVREVSIKGHAGDVALASVSPTTASGSAISYLC